MYAWIGRILDYYVLLLSDLRDPAGKGGGLSFAESMQISSVLRRLPVVQAGDMFHTNLAPGCTVAPIVSITISQG